MTRGWMFPLALAYLQCLRPGYSGGWTSYVEQCRHYAQRLGLHMEDIL